MLRSFFLSIFKGIPREEYDLITALNVALLDEKAKALKLGELEAKITNKYPKVEKLYGARPIPPEVERILTDPRIFFTPYDSKLTKIAKSLEQGPSDDDKVYQAFKWVRKNIKYKYDKDNFGSSEFWSFPFETLSRKTGDCDSQSILLANLCLVMGVPYWKLRLTCGPVKGGYHAFLTYYVESEDKWVLMDTTYYPNHKHPKDRPSYKQETNYFDTIWFSWDQKFIYQKSHKNWIA